MTKIGLSVICQGVKVKFIDGDGERKGCGRLNTSAVKKGIVNIVSLLPGGRVCRVVVIHLLVEPAFGGGKRLVSVAGLKLCVHEVVVASRDTWRRSGDCHQQEDGKHFQHLSSWLKRRKMLKKK